MNAPKLIGYCALVAIVCLYIVGLVSNGVLRHAVQTLPLWFVFAVGLRGREMVKYASLPCFLVWFVLMVLIWLFLLGWARVISGHFTPVEIVLTLIIGLASAAGLLTAWRWKTSLSAAKALFIVAIFAVFQIAALRISFLPSIARDR